MSVEEELARSSPGKDTLLAVGVFDGVHLGHKYLLSQLTEQARQQDLLPGVVTFRQHPQEVLAPRTRLPFLTDLAERSSLLKDEGVEFIVPLSFTMELARLDAREFASLLQKYLRMRGLVIGFDFALGRDREGSADALRLLGREMGFSVDVVPPVTVNGEVVSSTAIREALADGDMKRVRRLAGRYFSLQGRVVTGSRRGAYIDGRAYRSVTNIGQNPTFAGGERTVEVYILDYQDDLYGQELGIDIVARLRGERQFDSAAELQKQMAADVKQGRAILDSRGEDQA